MAFPEFQVFEGKDGQWYFRLVALNGETVASSEGYSSKDAAVKGTNAVRAAAHTAVVVFKSH